MCRWKNNCTELDLDSRKWDIYCPLRPPIWIDSQVDIFCDALEDFIQGDKETCLDKLSKIRNAEMQTWFIEHGQMSWKHRKNILQLAPPMAVDISLRDTLREPKKYQEEVFLRDWYRCRYCGNRLISQKLIRNFVKRLDSPFFHRGETNLDTHGIVHMTWPVADHVIPWNLGGRTHPSNLVSACAACNYGKDRFTLDQLWLENPFNRPPITASWDGLSSKLSELQKS